MWSNNFRRTLNEPALCAHVGCGNDNRKDFSVKRIVILGLAISPLLLIPAVAGDNEADFVSMFNGRDLEGWEGLPGKWWVEDEAITAESTEENPCLTHHYLYWRVGKPADFILRFEYRIMGEGANSGVHIRSEERPDFDIWGYQADIEAGDQWTGCLFQHDRGGVVMRGKRAVISEDGERKEEEFACPEALQEHIRADDWNEYEVIARGSQIALYINGHLMSEVDDRDKEMSRSQGHIALQMHPGPPMKVQFRNLRINVLD